MADRDYGTREVTYSQGLLICMANDPIAMAEHFASNMPYAGNEQIRQSLLNMARVILANRARRSN
jgi:hypothetical protein